MGKVSQLNIGLIGAGVVGGGVVRNLTRNADLIAERLGMRLNLKWVCDKDESKLKGLPVPDERADPRRASRAPRSRRPRRHRTRRRDRLREDRHSRRAQPRQGRRHRQQGAARASRRGDLRGGSEEFHQRLLRSQRLRRHPDHQGPARRFRRQPVSRSSTASSTAPAITSSRA